MCYDARKRSFRAWLCKKHDTEKGKNGVEDRITKEKHQKISQVFQKWLLLVVCVAFLVTTAFLWFFQTNLSQRNAINLLH